MKTYKVVITADAKTDLRKYLEYLRVRKRNPQAARNVLEDFRATKESLCLIADSIREPESEELRVRKLKRLNFVKGHQYFILFQIAENEQVRITNVFHMLENFESRLR